MSASLGRSPKGAIASVCDDIDVLSAPNHVEPFQLQAPVGSTFAGREIIFVAVPGADEMHFIAGKLLPEPAAIRSDHVLDLVHHDALTSWPALMHTQVLVSIELAFPMEDADLAPAMGHNTAFALGKLRDLGDKYLRH